MNTLKLSEYYELRKEGCIVTPLSDEVNCDIREFLVYNTTTEELKEFDSEYTLISYLIYKGLITVDIKKINGSFLRSNRFDFILKNNDIIVLHYFDKVYTIIEQPNYNIDYKTFTGKTTYILKGIKNVKLHLKVD